MQAAASEWALLPQKLCMDTKSPPKFRTWATDAPLQCTTLVFPSTVTAVLWLCNCALDAVAVLKIIIHIEYGTLNRCSGVREAVLHSQSNSRYMLLQCTYAATETALPAHARVEIVNL